MEQVAAVCLLGEGVDHGGIGDTVVVDLAHWGGGIFVFGDIVDVEKTGVVFEDDFSLVCEVSLDDRQSAGTVDSFEKFIGVVESMEDVWFAGVGDSDEPLFVSGDDGAGDIVGKVALVVESIKIVLNLMLGDSAESLVCSI